MTAAQASSLDVSGVVERSDFWRRSPASVGGPAGHKEWSYFCVLGDDVQLVTAFSIMDRSPRADGSTGCVEEARVTILARGSDRQWNGDIELSDPAGVAIQAGRVDARFGRNELRFSGGAYRIRAEVGPSLGASLVLRPTARPALTRSVPLGATDPMQWFVVPRLEASGEVRIGNRVHTVAGSPADHDHNWGRFTWGGDFAWEWGIALAPPGLPWSLVYYRITDRGRHQVGSQGLLLWRADRHQRTFRDGELAIRSHGLHRRGIAVRLPRIMRLAVPGCASDIPQRLEVSARSGEDVIEVTFEVEDCAQICLPQDADDYGITAISECPARALVTGRLNGAGVRFECRAVLEFNRAAH